MGWRRGEARVALLAVCAAVLALAGCGSSPPRIVLWAWERPEDLRFLEPGRIGVAYLAGTIFLENGAVRAVPRMQPLRLAEGMRPIAVVRIEAAQEVLVDAQAAPAAEAIRRWSDRPEVDTVQIDFDATVSQRGFYRQLLERLQGGKRLTITALASWCLDDPWIADLPVAEAIPMLFQMGPDAVRIRRMLDGGREFGPAMCRQSAGISTDEPLPRLPSNRRLFIFHSRAWTPAIVEDTLGSIGARR